MIQSEYHQHAQLNDRSLGLQSRATVAAILLGTDAHLSIFYPPTLPVTHGTSQDIHTVFNT